MQLIFKTIYYILFYMNQYIVFYLHELCHYIIAIIGWIFKFWSFPKIKIETYPKIIINDTISIQTIYGAVLLNTRENLLFIHKLLFIIMCFSPSMIYIIVLYLCITNLTYFSLFVMFYYLINISQLNINYSDAKQIDNTFLKLFQT